jgi:stage II sporulation protein E
MPRAALYGQMTPFGISLVAAMDKPLLPVLLSVAVGYLLGDTPSPLRYIAAVAAVGGLRWILAAIPEWEKRAFIPPLTAFIATLATGLALIGNGIDGYLAIILVAESGVAAGCSLFLRTSIGLSRRLNARDDTRGITPPQQASLILTGAIGLMAASTITIGPFAPARILAAGMVLVAARAGQEQGGCMAGVIVGAATALSSPGQLAAALALAFGGFLAGVFSRFGRLAQAAAFLVAAGILTLTDTSDDVLVRLYELLAADILFLLLPPRVDRRLHRLVLRGREAPAVEGVRREIALRLQVAANTMSDVGQTVHTVTERLSRHSAPDTATLLRDCRAAVCGRCPMQAICWGDHAEEMQVSLEQLIPLLKQHGQVTAADLRGFPAERCRQPERLTERLSRDYERYITRESAWRRLGEIQHSVNDQFSGMAALLGSMAQDLTDPSQVDVELSGRVAAVCADHGMPVRQALCTRSRGNLLTVHILAEDVGITLSGGRWLRDMRAACACHFAPPVADPCGNEVRITLSEPPRYTVEWGIAQRLCDGEKLCGDAADTFIADGRSVLMLSDGMGSGGHAAVDSAMAVGLSARLWKAGFSPDSILHSVNAALLVKSREESLATLDVAVVDTFSGRLDLYKAGATASLLCSGTRVSRLERTSLPLGILTDVHFEHCADWLTDGDVLLMMSDGALAGGLAPVEVLLRDRPAEESMQSLADRIADAARAAEDKHPDDITVLAARLRLTEPPHA